MFNNMIELLLMICLCCKWWYL